MFRDEDMFSFLMELIKVDTDSRIRKNYKEIVEIIEGKAEDLGFESFIHNYEDEKGPLPSILIWPQEIKADTNVILLSHYDVVPAEGPWRLGDLTFDPFNPIRTNGRIYGRGAADDKSAIALSLSVLYKVRERYSRGGEVRFLPIMAVVGDEEVGGKGVYVLMEEGFKEAGVKPDNVIVIDAAPSFIGVGASGVLHGWVKFKGVSGHAGRPFLSKNPVHIALRMGSDLLTLFSDKISSMISRIPSPPGSPVNKLWGRFSITIMEGGNKHNVIPDEARLGFDLRFIPDVSKENVVEELRALVTNLATKYGAEVELIIEETFNPGWMTDPDNYLVKVALNAYQKHFGTKRIAASLGGNDGYIFANRGIPTISLGTIEDESRAHSSLENVKEDVVRAVRDTLVDLIVISQ